MWLHIRMTPIAGVLFLYLATVTPLLLDITRQAHRCGLAFLAMSILIVAALEADHYAESVGRSSPSALAD